MEKNYNIPEDDISKIKKICSYFDITDKVYDDSISLVEEIYEKNLYNGRSKDALIGGVIYTVIKYNDIAIDVEKISSFLDVEKRSLILSNKYISNNLSDFNSLPQKWEKFIEYADSELNINSDIINCAYKIGKKGEQKSLLSGRKPQTYAAGCIYAASNINKNNGITQRELSETLNISPSTIRVSYNNLVNVYNNNE